MKETEMNVFQGDCFDILDEIDKESVDLVYMDPPFFTQSIHRMTTREGDKTFSFADVWDSDSSYANFIFQRLLKIRNTMKASGVIFFHCDTSASHIIRLMLDSVFGPEQFRSEIIWSFRRWSNSKRGLMNNHQTIYFYSKENEFKFFPIFSSYSESTNVDQIMQKRSRDHRNKSIYARDENGNIISNGGKNGVPLGDVWDIPFLNPKAKERVGYPTQKPILLLERIIQMTTESGDLVLDPFCGSGTTLVAAKLLNRRAVGIDISEDAVAITKQRLRFPVVTRSALAENGRSSYLTHDKSAAAYLQGIDYIPIQRNRGIDALLKQTVSGLPVFVRVQREGEAQAHAAAALLTACKEKGKCLKVLISTSCDSTLTRKNDVIVVNSTKIAISTLLDNIQNDQGRALNICANITS